ncbi:MAG: protein kinase [Acidobacteria bacterium]|nr:protein kinase [Acidobacteriota bacterium]
MSLEKSTRLGRFEIISGIAKGGMGEVYLAKDTELDRNVAIKVLPAELTDNKERLLRFEQEARTVSALNHPYILTVFEFGKSDDGRQFIATEFVEGVVLSELCLEEPIDLSRALDIALQIASALSAAHSAGLAHRDIKPDNIMVRPDGYIKVLDFGLAKLTDSGGGEHVDLEGSTRELFNTSPGSIVGTAAYMSPEQARGLPVDTRTDLWSLGVVIYEMVSGRKPFRGATSTDTIISVIQKEPPPITSYVEDIPSDLVWIISKALTKDLDGRYQTAKELYADLEKIKKRVEFESEIDRSTPPEGADKKPAEDTATRLLERPPTSPGIPDVTRDEAAHGSGLEHGASRQSGRRMVWALLGVLLVAVISVGAYFYFAGGLNSDQIDSIAVLPFDNGSEDKKLAFLADGLSESLIDSLSQLPQLKVIARNSSFKFRGADIDISDVAQKLGVRAIVMGRVNQQGDDLAIRIEVIDARDNKQLWGEQYNRRSNDLVSIQSEIAKMVSEKLRLKLTGAQETQLANGGTRDSEAYRQYLNGLVELNGPAEVRGNALDYFQKAVEMDPKFAPAYAEIALIYLDRANGAGEPAVLIPKAKEAAQKALVIDSNLAKAHIANASIQEYMFDWKGADAEYKKAIGLNPNLDSARYRYAFYLAIQNRKNDAIREIDEAEKRDPINKSGILLWKGSILTMARQFDEAIKTYDEANKLSPNGTPDNFSLGYAYAGKGAVKEAVSYYKRSIEALGGEDKYSQPLVYLAALYAKMPDKRDQALEILERLETTDEYVSPSIIAVLYAALGEKDKAIESLEKAYKERDLLLRFIGVGYEYDALRSDPRFLDLIKRTGLPNTQK